MRNQEQPVGHLKSPVRSGGAIALQKWIHFGSNLCAPSCKNFMVRVFAFFSKEKINRLDCALN